MNFRSAILLIQNTKAVSYKKGEIVIPEGSQEKIVLFIRKGLLRSFYTDVEKVEEITFQLYPERNIALNLHSVLFGEPSKFVYQAIEDTKAFQIDYSSLIALTSKNSDLINFNRTYLTKNVLGKVFTRMESFVFLSPEERYEKFVKNNPSLVNRTPDKYIANVLGITPVSLSRIRSRITKKS